MVRRFWIAALAILICGLPVDSIAQDTVTLSPMAGIYVFEGNQELKDAPLFSLGFGYNITERFGLEAVVYYGEPGFVGKEDGNLFGARLDMLYELHSQARLVPYLAAGLGANLLWSDDIKEADEDLLFAYGGGLKWYLNDFLALRADLRHVLNYNVNDINNSNDFYNNLSATAGISLRFGADKTPTAVATAAEPVRRPEPPLPPVTEPETQPAIIPAPVPETAAAEAVADGDRDGVPDDQDKCPNTPWGAVDKNGCPQDSDGDGVADLLDQCPGTPQGVRIDAEGCLAQESFRLTIEFALKDTAVSPVYHRELKQAADFIKRVPKGKFVVEGHTDSIGPERYNQFISEKRAQSVRTYLIEQFGIAPERIEAQGYGESLPIAENSTPQGRLQNRRVVLTYYP